jgi:hypothetical protein
MNMNCEDFELIVDDLQRPGALGESTETLARFHARTCELCAVRLAQARALSVALRFAAEDGIPAGAPERVEAMLRSAFHRQRWAVQREQSSRRWTAAVIAATLLFTGALATRSWRKPTVSARRSESATANVEKPAVPLTSPAVTSSPAPAMSANPSAGREGKVDSGAAQIQQEFTTDFLPYPPGGNSAPFETGQVVRVSLTGSSLAAMGYPVDGDRVGDAFTADVLLGEDGQPRAIRLLR